MMPDKRDFIVPVEKVRKVIGCGRKRISSQLWYDGSGNEKGASLKV